MCKFVLGTPNPQFGVEGLLVREYELRIWRLWVWREEQRAGHGDVDSTRASEGTSPESAGQHAVSAATPRSSPWQGHLLPSP